MRISDWSSDVCSADLAAAAQGGGQLCLSRARGRREPVRAQLARPDPRARRADDPDRARRRRADELCRLECVGRPRDLLALSRPPAQGAGAARGIALAAARSEEHTSETPVTNAHLVCRLLLEKKNHKLHECTPTSS